MDLNTYLSSTSFKTMLKQFTTNTKFETTEKVEANAIGIASDAYNEGIFSIINKSKTFTNKSPIEKSSELTSLLPDNFIKGESGKQAINGIMSSIESNQQDGLLNIGYEALIQRDVENFIRIVYAIGLTSGFEIADDPDCREIFLANKNRFLLHGSESKSKVTTSSKAKKANTSQKVSKNID